MNKYLKLVIAFTRTSIAAQAGFRADFILGIFINMLWILAYVVLIATLFYNTTSIVGWDRSQVVIIFGIFETLDGLATMFIGRNLEAIASLVRDGSMDYVLTKPIDSQFHVTFRRFSLSDIGVFITGILALVYGFSTNTTVINPSQIAPALLLVACGLVLYYSVSMLVETLCFWFIRVENLPVLVDVTYIVARYPLNVFEGVMRRIVFYVVPLAFFATVPALVLFEKVPTDVTVTTGIALAAVFFLASRLFWYKGLKAYSSASS